MQCFVPSCTPTSQRAREYTNDNVTYISSALCVFRRGDTTASGEALEDATLHCSPLGRFESVKPSLTYANVCAVRNRSTALTLLYANTRVCSQYMLECVVATERALNHRHRDALLARVRPKLVKVRRADGAWAAVRWLRAYRAVYGAHHEFVVPWRLLLDWNPD